jgi:hypothetical protein
VRKLIAGPEQVTPQWLTGVLEKRGLNRGRVLSVQPVDRSLHVDPWFADLSFLRVRYSDSAPASAPRRLVLKVPKPDLSPAELEYGRREVLFYSAVASAMDDPPLARCYDAVYEPETGRSHILLEDLSETHSQPRPPLPPSKLHCELLVDSLARLHAHWWEHAWEEMDIGGLPGKDASLERVLRYPYTMSETANMLPGFVDFLGDRLSLDRRRLYEQVLSSWPFPGLIERLEERWGLTLVHGDAHVWNFLYPLNPERDRVRIIDWHEWGMGLGTDDLAETVALWWYPERRARLEAHLLQRYHERLVEHGVQRYGWERCRDDYRLSVVKCLLAPVWMHAEGRAPAAWWPTLERVVLAFQDLGCVELLR